MFASIKNLFFGSNNSDPFDMEQRTKALLVQTHRKRTAGKQSQQRAHRPMQAAAIPSAPPATTSQSRSQSTPQSKQAQTQRRPIANSKKSSLTNLKSDLF